MSRQVDEVVDRVLVLDEHGRMIATHANVLGAYGCVVIAARTLGDAIGSAADALPSIAIIDLVSPPPGADAVGGVELAVHLRREYGSECPPLVLVATPDIQLPAMRQLLFDAIVVKPYSVAGFAELVRRLAAEHRAQQDLPSSVRLGRGLCLAVPREEDR